jgi:PleD family two-component response regulator
MIVHSEDAFLQRAAAALRSAGHDVAACLDPYDALSIMDGLAPIDVLVTRTFYPEGRPNGISLALMARRKRPGIKIVFTSREEKERFTEGIGELVPHPVSLPALIEAVSRALSA